MNYALIENGIVANIILADSDFAESVGAIPAGDAAIGDLWDGNVFTKPPADTEIIIADVVTATQARLDAFAHTRNYDGILNACTYATSAIQKFNAEGQYCVQARDNTWASLYAFMAEVQAGTQPMPSGFADVEPLLPVLVWPS